MHNFHSKTAADLRVIANNLDVFSSEPHRYHLKDTQTKALTNNAHFLRRTALFIIQQESKMGRVADDLKKAEANEQAALAKAATSDANAARLQAELDAAKPNMLDAADLAALDKFESDQAATTTPTPPDGAGTTPTDTTGTTPPIA